MDAATIREHLLCVARERLAQSPSGFKRFRFHLDQTLEGAVLVSSVQLDLTANESEGVQAGRADAQKRFQERLVAVIDAWAYRRSFLPVAPALRPQGGQTEMQRQEHRYRLCVAEGLEFPKDPSARLPRGINQVAKVLGISRQALAQDLHAYRLRAAKQGFKGP